jgi:hypothetical protein
MLDNVRQDAPRPQEMAMDNDRTPQQHGHSHDHEWRWMQEFTYLLSCNNGECGMTLPSRRPQYAERCPRCGGPMSCIQQSR